MKKTFVIGLMLALAFISCQSGKNGNGDKIVATVYDKNLYQSDLQSVLYEGINATDSLVRTKAFIDNWIRRQLLIHQAENDIDKSELDFSRQIEDYRNSLIIYKYESKLIDNNLDTIVSDIEISNYFKSNSSNFKLGNNIARIAVVVFDKKSVKKWQLTQLMNSETLLIDSIRSMAEKYCVSYDLNVDEWHIFEEIVEKYDLNASQVGFLQKNQFLRFDRDENTYLFRMCEYRKIGEDSPLEMEKEAIRYIILNMRKKALIDKMNNNLYNQAVRDRVFVIF